MVKKLFASLAFLAALANPAWATNHYFDSSASDSTQPCTIGDPCNNFNASGLDVSGLACGDHIKLKRGKEWAGGEAWIRVNVSGSSSCSSNPVIVEAYGDAGERPWLNGEYVTTGFSTASGSGSSTIYSKTGQTQTYLKTVGWKISGVRGAMAYWSGATNALPDGSFKRSGTTLYFNPPGSANPETSEIRIGNFAAGVTPDGQHGLLEGGEDVTTSSYIRFRDIGIHAANGVGVSLNGVGDRTLNLKISGNGQEGWLCWHLGFSGACSDFWDYGSEVSYSAAGANGGGGSGQAITSWGGPQGGFTGTYSHDNWMATFDLLDFSGATNVTEVFLLRTRLKLGGGSPSNPSYDPTLYLDGASEVAGYGNIILGRWGNYLNNAAGTFIIGSEHPTLKPAQNFWFSNTLLASGDWTQFITNNICYGSTSECPPSGDSTPPQNIQNITLIYSTFLDWSTGIGDGSIFDLEETSTSTDNVVMRGNIFVIKNGGYLSYYNFPTDGRFDADYNNYYVRSQSSSSTNMTRVSGVAKTLSQFAAITGEDSHSFYGSPLLTTDSATAPVVTLGDGSPAIDACGSISPPAIPSWVPQTIKDDIGPSPYVRGSTRPSGVEDTGATDCGFHYDYANLTNVSVALGSSVASTTTTATVTFTMPDKVAFMYLDSVIKFTLPTGWIFNSGGTSVATSSDISGTWAACTVASQTISCARVGDGNSEFPGTFHWSVDHVRTQSNAGTSGTFAFEIHRADGDPVTGLTKMSENSAIAGVSISSGSPAVCGNSAIESGESCDDGNTTALDGCSATCQTETPVCGNSVVEYLEQCDDGNTTALDGCSATCQIENPVCGNGATESGEECDDGNTDDGDGCDSDCQDEAFTPGPHFSCAGPGSISGKATIS